MALFDGVRLPLLQVHAGFGGTLDPGDEYLHLGVGPGLGTALLAGPSADTDISADVRSITLTALGAPNDIDPADPITCTLVVNNRDGDYDPTNPSSPYTGTLEDGTPIRVRAVWAGEAYNLFYGELSGITLDLDVSGDHTATLACRDLLEKLGRAYLPERSATQDGDTTGQRIAWLADEAAHPSALRDIATGYSLLGRTEAGASALDLMRTTALTEFGPLFCDGAGRLVFYDRHHAATATRSTTVQASFADTVGTVRLAGLQLTRSRDGTANRVAITRDPAPSDVATAGPRADEDTDAPVEQVADDFTEQGTKGVLAFPAQVGQLVRNDSEALAMAEYLLDRYAAISNRISALDINAMRGEWDSLLALGPLDRIEVSVDYGPNTVTAELLIQSIAHTIGVSPPSWQMQLTTSNPPGEPTLFVLGTAQLGSSTTGRLGW